MHLIWVGWLVALGALYNSLADQQGCYEIPMRSLTWSWMVVLVFTLLVIGINFSRVTVALMTAAAMVVGLAIGLIQALSHLPILQDIARVINQVPVRIEWGVPFVVSLALGLTMAVVTTWRRMNDRWILKAEGNYLEHENFQERDDSIGKDAKTIVAVFPCLLKRYLFFGLGNIEFHSSSGTETFHAIEGVFFARHHAAVIEHRFGTTDVHAISDADEFSE